MNLSKIKRLCLSEGKCLIVRDRHGGQWIGVEKALYPVIGLELDQKSLCVIWQLTDKQANDLAFEERMDLEGFLDTGMVLDEGRPQVMDKALINHIHFMGIERDDGRVLMVNEELLAPAWVKGEWRRYQLQETREGAVLMIFRGLMVSGVVKPAREGEARGMLEALASIAQKGLVDVGEAKVWDKPEPALETENEQIEL